MLAVFVVVIHVYMWWLHRCACHIMFVAVTQVYLVSVTMMQVCCCYVGVWKCVWILPGVVVKYSSAVVVPVSV